MAVPSEYRQLRNSIAGAPENVQAGMEHFSDHCACAPQIIRTAVFSLRDVIENLGLALLNPCMALT
jgi:hypothetical protein